MEYTTLKLYESIGQYDRTCVINFRFNSEARTKYGNDLVGCLHYSLEERKSFQKQLETEISIGEHGIVRLNVWSSYYAQEIKNEAKRTGFSTKDISYVGFFNDGSTNNYVSDQLRALPELVKINFPTKDWNSVRAKIFSIHLHIQAGNFITEFERDDYLACLFLDNDEKVPEGMPENLFFHPVTKELHSPIYLKILERKYESGKANEGEEKIFILYRERVIEWRVYLARKQLNSYTRKEERTQAKYSNVLNSIPYLAAEFQEERLLVSKFPIWWNWERFFHIVFGHVKGLQVGKELENTPFQYAAKDIRDLIKVVLKQLSPEIDEYFAAKSGKPFKRQGTMCHYYNGDYYAIDIRSDGLLMAFYKAKYNKPRH